MIKIILLALLAASTIQHNSNWDQAISSNNNLYSKVISGFNPLQEKKSYAYEKTQYSQNLAQVQQFKEVLNKYVEAEQTKLLAKQQEEINMFKYQVALDKYYSQEKVNYQKYLQETQLKQNSIKVNEVPVPVVTEVTEPTKVIETVSFVKCGNGNYYDKSEEMCKKCHHSCSECQGSAKNCKSCKEYGNMKLYKMSSENGENRCFVNDFEEDLHQKFCKGKEGYYFDKTTLQCQQIVEENEHEVVMSKELQESLMKEINMNLKDVTVEYKMKEQSDDLDEVWREWSVPQAEKEYIFDPQNESEDGDNVVIETKTSDGHNYDYSIWSLDSEVNAIKTAMEKTLKGNVVKLTKYDGTDLSNGTLSSNGVQPGDNLKAMVSVNSDCEEQKYDEYRKEWKCVKPTNYLQSTFGILSGSIALLSAVFILRKKKDQKQESKLEILTKNEELLANLMKSHEL